MIIQKKNNDINELRKEVNDKNSELHGLKLQLVAQTEPALQKELVKPLPKKISEKTVDEIKTDRIERIEKEKFKELLKEGLMVYEKMQKTGDEKAIGFAKEKLFDLAGEDLEKKKLIEKEIEELSLIKVVGKSSRRKK